MCVIVKEIAIEIFPKPLLSVPLITSCYSQNLKKVVKIQSFCTIFSKSQWVKIKSNFVKESFEKFKFDVSLNGSQVHILLLCLKGL